MGLLKRFGRSRSSEKVASNHDRPPKESGGALKKLQRIRSKSRGQSTSSRSDLSPENETAAYSQSNSLVSTRNQSELTVEPPWVKAPRGNPQSQLRSVSSSSHSMEHKPETSFEQSSLYMNQSQQQSPSGRRPHLPAPPKPPVDSHSPKNKNGEKRGNNTPLSPQAQRFDKPLVIEIPRIVCENCKEACMVEALKINNVYYHPSCFVCNVCNVQLSNGPYFAKDGAIYCSKDFNALFGTKCRSCKKYIQGDVVAVLGFTYHPSCFNCSRCGRKFEAGQEVIIDKDETYCESCPVDDRFLQPVMFCGGCKEVIVDPSKSLCALDGNWHPRCLKCFACHTLLTKEYFVHGQNIFCEKDYLKQFGVKCNYCTEYIVGKVIEAGSKRYHPSCALCSVCNGIFAEGQDMLVHGDQVWHPDCNSKHSSKKLSRSTANDSFQDSVYEEQEEFNISDDLNSINVVTLDYSVPEELLKKLDHNRKNQAKQSQDSRSTIPTTNSVPEEPELEFYEKLFSSPMSNFSTLVSSSPIPQKWGPKSKGMFSQQPSRSGAELNKSQPIPRSFNGNGYNYESGQDLPDFAKEDSIAPLNRSQTMGLSSQTLMVDMPRSRSFDRSKLTDVSFTAPLMSENMFRSKSNDRLKVFQPKGAEAYIGGYLNPAEPSDLAPGVFQRFPSLKNEALKRQNQTPNFSSQKSIEKVATKPGNLNSRGFNRRAKSHVDDSTDDLKSQNGGVTSCLKKNQGSMKAATFTPSRSKSSFDIGNRTRRVDSDNFTEYSAKCFYERERMERLQQRSNASIKEDDDRTLYKYDEYLRRSAVGKDLLKPESSELEDSLKVSDDPRSASRDPSALKPPPNPLRFKNPYQASPSRVLGYFELMEENADNSEEKDMSEIFSSRGRKQTSLRERNKQRQISLGTATDDSGLDCFSEPEGPRRSTSRTLLDDSKNYRSDFEPAETSKKQRKNNERRAKLMHDHFISYMKAVKEGYVSGYNTEENLDEVANHSKTSAAGKEVTIYPLSKLQTTNRRLPKDVKRRSLEVHLSEQEFYQTFLMSRSAFYELPVWKRNILKKLNYLF